MDGQGIVGRDGLVGYAALREAPSVAEFDERAYQLASRFDTKNPPSLYLENPSYDSYMRMHKVLVGETGACRLLDIADKLAAESLPKYLEAAGSAYMEAALALSTQPTAARIELADLAEATWQRALRHSQQLIDDPELAQLYEDSDQFRTATSLAFAPLHKSIIVGDVTAAARQQVFTDLLAISQTSAVQLELASRQQDHEAVADHVGFLHESNVLLGLLYHDDPKYVPSPSFDRADHGVYHRRQTHDIVIFNQHWGNIKKITPLEVKARTSPSDHRRYYALLVRGKMHIIANHGYNPLDTLTAFANIHSGGGSDKDYRAVSYATENLRNLLRMYKRSGRRNMINTSSPTVFHDSRYVRPLYVGG